MYVAVPDNGTCITWVWRGCRLRTMVGYVTDVTVNFPLVLTSCYKWVDKVSHAVKLRISKNAARNVHVSEYQKVVGGVGFWWWLIGFPGFWSTTFLSPPVTIETRVGQDADQCYHGAFWPTSWVPTLTLSLSLSLQGAVTKCDVDAVPMFVFFRNRKVLYQVGMYMFQNGDLHVTVTYMFHHFSSAILLGLIRIRLTHTS